MRKKQFYEKPSMKAFELKQQPTLLAGSTPNQAGFEDYEEDEEDKEDSIIEDYEENKSDKIEDDGSDVEIVA